MKKILFSLIGLLAFALVAPAQQYTVSSVGTNTATAILNGTTNHVVNATTNALGYPITCTKFGDVGIQVVFKLTASGTTAVIFKFSESLDGVNYVANTARTLSVTPAGTAVVTGLTNQVLNGIGYLRLDTIENANSTDVTNLSVMLVTKPSRFGN
jgi:hypothetical protein